MLSVIFGACIRPVFPAAGSACVFRLTAVRGVVSPFPAFHALRGFLFQFGGVYLGSAD